jgi:hypothetical protein
VFGHARLFAFLSCACLFVYCVCMLACKCASVFMHGWSDFSVRACVCLPVPHVLACLCAYVYLRTFKGGGICVRA